MFRGRVTSLSLSLLLVACGGGAPPPQVAPTVLDDHAATPQDAVSVETAAETFGRLQEEQQAAHYDPVHTADLAAMASDPDPELRLDAIEALGDYGDPRGVAALQQALHLESGWRQRVVIRALADIGTSDAVDVLGSVLVADDPDTREAAVMALMDVGGNEVLGFLQQALSDMDPGVRAEAAAALAELHAVDTGTRE